MTDRTENIRQVFEKWSLYDRVLQHNLMRHREVIASLRNQFPTEQPLRVLDMGCGNGWLAEQIFDGRAISSYTGIDLSAAALAIANLLWEYDAEEVHLLQGNFEEQLPRLEPGSEDVILASYSLHHFPTPDKGTLLRECRRILAPAGELAWVDIYCQPAENRSAYLTRFHEQVLPEWPDFSEDDRQQVIDHMNESDFPETEEEMQRLILDAGFSRFRKLFADDCYGCWVISG